MAANADFDQVLTSGTITTLFDASVSPCIDNAMAVALHNTGANPMLVWCRGHHGETEPTTGDSGEGWLLVAADGKVSFDVADRPAQNPTILKLIATVPTGGGSTTCTFGVVKRR